MNNGSDKMAQLQESMSRASRLMQLESNGTLSKIANSQRDNIGASLMSEGISTADMITTMDNVDRSQAPVNIPSRGGGSHLPAAILESFKKQPSVTESEMYTAFGPDGDMMQLVEGTKNKIAPQQSKPIVDVKQQVHEALHGGNNVNGPMPSNINSSVDYPMIRTIVEDVVRKYASSLNKKIINESKQSLNEVNTMIIGKNFKFLDSKGNIYEATLKKVGNINDKKAN